MSPMCMYSSDTKDGQIRPFHLTHYESRAVGQVGLIMLEATAVTPQGRISDSDLGIWDDEHVEGLTTVVKRIQSYDAKAGIQLAHAGRKATIEGHSIAPSAIAFSDDMKAPVEMSSADIQETIEAFRIAAERADTAGFDMIELHGAHGYLINSFLSPLSNKRIDEYGGSLENRFRFLSEIVAAVRAVWTKPLFVRISADEYSDGGNTLADFVQICRWLKKTRN